MDLPHKFDHAPTGFGARVAWLPLAATLISERQTCTSDAAYGWSCNRAMEDASLGFIVSRAAPSCMRKWNRENRCAVQTVATQPMKYLHTLNRCGCD